MQKPQQKLFNLEYIENELEKLDAALDGPLKIYVAGGFVMSTNKLKPGTKDIDVIVERRPLLKMLGKSLEKSGYSHLPMNSVTIDYKDLSAEIYENHDEFRWDIFTRIVAHKLALTQSMKLRARLTHVKEKLSLFELSKEDIFLMKGVTDRERDLEDMSLIAKSGVDYDTILEECLIQSDRTGTLWEMGLHDKCEDLEEKFGIKVPIVKKLRKTAENKMLTRRISASLERGSKTRDQLAVKLRGKLRKSEIDIGIRLLREQGRIRVSSAGKITKIKARGK
jgi:hypothetical protein